VPRSGLWRALTPQLFPYQVLRNALKTCLSESKIITDEASAMELQGKPVLLVEGRSDNIKITTPEDLRLAAFLLEEQEREND
jgi:2-C-methyl-D-erythritol 4-phosphate cytidylyltransferase